MPDVDLRLANSEVHVKLKGGAVQKKVKAILAMAKKADKLGPPSGSGADLLPSVVQDAAREYLQVRHRFILQWSIE